MIQWFTIIAWLHVLNVVHRSTQNKASSPGIDTLSSIAALGLVATPTIWFTITFWDQIKFW